MQQKYYDILKKYWGYEKFRPLQLEVIEQVVAGRDVVVLMPTGAGKSLLYQLPAIAMDGVCVVVTPLIALMKDQVDRLRKLGIQAVAVHSGMTSRQIDIALDNCVYGDVKFLYVSPERTTTEIFRMRVQKMPIALIAIDEAHCISQWGYDFRPSYLRLAELRELQPEVGFLALTATATPLVAEDIQRNLEMKECQVRRTTFARENLSYSVRLVEDKMEQLLRIVRNVSGSGIVYARTREMTVELAAALNENGISADYYHGGLLHRARAEKQESWTRGETQVVVATNAFGMGIDKSDVRFVVHWDACDSLEEYYQEAGRAGRDGRRSYAVLLYSASEPMRAVRRFESEFPPLEKIKECYEAVFNFLQIGIGDGKFASMVFDLFEFSKRHKFFQTTVVNSIKILQQNGYMTLTDSTDNPPRIKFIVGRDELYRIRIEREELDVILRVILRLYTGVFNGFVRIEIAEIVSVSGYTQERVKELLKRLWELRVIKYIPEVRSPLLILNEERLPISDVRISPESYQMRKDMAAERLKGVFEYATNEEECRSAVLQRYFGEEDVVPCGVCDTCIERRKRDDAGSVDLREEILEALEENRQSVKSLVGRFRENESSILAVIDGLLEKGEISIDSAGKIGINE